MRCGLSLPDGRGTLHLDPIEPALTAEVQIGWVGRKIPLKVSAVVDTGCPVDIVASTELAAELKRDLRPARPEILDWGGRIETEVYVANLKFAAWEPVEVHVPLEGFAENLLGLRALLKANLCLRGEDGSAYWARLPEAGESHDFITRDSDREEGSGSAVRPVARPRRKRTR